MHRQIVNILQILVFTVIIFGIFILYRSGIINDFFNKSGLSTENVTPSEKENIEPLPAVQDETSTTEPHADRVVAAQNHSTNITQDSNVNSEERMYFAPEFSTENINSSRILFADTKVNVDGETNRVRIPVWVISDKVTFKQYLEIQLMPRQTLKSINHEDRELTRTPNDFVIFERRVVLNGKLLSSSVYAEKDISSDSKLTFEVTYGTGVQYQFFDQSTSLDFLKNFIETIKYNPSVLSEITVFFSEISNVDNTKATQAINDANKSVKGFTALGVLSEPYGISNGAKEYVQENSQMSGFCEHQKEYFESKGFINLDYTCVDGKTSAALYTEVDSNLFLCVEALDNKRQKVVTSDRINSDNCDMD